MTSTEKYIQLIVPYLATAEGATVETKQMNGATAYMFPCPFCSHLTTTSGQKKDKKRTAILMPRRESKYVYVFKCHRGYSPECARGARNFHNFLAMFNADLFNQYQLEMNNRRSKNQ